MIQFNPAMKNFTDQLIKEPHQVDETPAVELDKEEFTLMMRKANPHIASRELDKRWERYCKAMHAVH